MSLVDLRSDTVTRPSPGMRDAMARAEVGDDVYGEDPTVNKLQEQVAELLGLAAALFVPSGTMANQIAIKLHTEPGDEVLVGEGAHNALFESGAAGALSGVQLATIGQGGFFTAADVTAAIKPVELMFAPTRLVSVENTHNRAGGRVWRREQLDAVLRVAQEACIRTHLDGARLWNAATAAGLSERELAAGFDTVSVCLSKGLGAPVGSLLCGSSEVVRKARRIRKMLGGGMRQAGVLAAAGLYALDHNRQRLAQDHENARWIAERLAMSSRYRIDLASVSTNIVMVECAAGAQTVVSRARDEGVLVHGIGPRQIRLVTHLDVDRAGCERALRVLLGLA